jgi:hypothetical protein
MGEHFAGAKLYTEEGPLSERQSFEEMQIAAEWKPELFCTTSGANGKGKRIIGTGSPSRRGDWGEDLILPTRCDAGQEV